jgi:hypothetical protein
MTAIASRLKTLPSSRTWSELGAFGVKGMALLDGANTCLRQPRSQHGEPRRAEESGILVSGHDLHDIEKCWTDRRTGVDSTPTPRCFPPTTTPTKNTPTSPQLRLLMVDAEDSSRINGPSS